MPQPEGRLPQVVKKREGPMPELKKRRACLALLGAFAMAASVLAVGASSVSAEAGRPEAAADYSACVGPATADAGFTDVAAGSTHDAAINCIAYYGITRGTTATTFSPGQTISRWQLAVMLQRAAAPAGVELPAAASQGFTDISGLGSSFQAAVNQMAELGIMAGTTATTFDPDGIVSRAVIVEALAGFLTNAQVGPGGKALSRGVDRSLTVKDGTTRNAMTIPIDETFRDLGAVTYSAFQSIRALAEMGVVQGRSDGTFGPAASVTRGQAAAFITRALAHTNARPAGLTMQAKKSAVADNEDFDLSVSMRGNDFAPIESAAVDFFTHSTSNAATAFKTDGTCNTGSGGVQAAGGGTGVCVIEIDDDVTEPDGNVQFNPDRITQETVYWAWSGDTGDRLDWDTSNLSMDNSDVSSAASITISTVTSPATAKVTTSVSSDAANGNTVRYGTTVTVTIQLQDSAGKDAKVAGRTYSWYATGTHSGGSLGVQLSGTGTRTTTTDSEGKAVFTLTQADPDTNPVGGQDDATTWTYRISAVPLAGGGTAALPVTNSAIGFTVASGMGTGSVVFDDDRSEAEKVSIDLQRAWTPQPAAGTTARVGVTGKVTDQYGNTLRGHPMFFDLDANGTFGCETWVANTRVCTTPGNGDDTIATDGSIDGTTRRVTRSSGTNTVSATWAAGTTQAATYTVAADLDGDGNVADANEQQSKTHYWVLDPLGWDSDTGTALPLPGFTGILIMDLANNAMVVNLPWAIVPNSNPRAVEIPDPARPLEAPLHRVYRYTDTTLFRWYVNGAEATTLRWLTAAEFEVRMAKHLAGSTPPGSPDSHVQVLAYETKTGFPVFGIRLATGRSVQDPASP